MSNHKLQICLVFWALAFAGTAYADLDPTTPHGLNYAPTGFLLQVWGLQADKHGQETPDGTLISNNSNGTATTAGLNICLVAVCENATETFGGFADLTSGKVGVFAFSADGFGFEQSQADVIVDLPFSGTGTATLTIHVQALINGPDDTQSSATFAGGVSAQAFDIVNGVPTLVGGPLSAGATLCNSLGDVTNSCAHGNTPVTQTSVDQDFSVTIPIDGTHSFYQIKEEFSATAEGTDSVVADHTGTLSIQLSPGVTFDNPYGFLTETNEPGVATPEPSSVAFGILGLALIVGRARAGGRTTPVRTADPK